MGAFYPLFRSGGCALKNQPLVYLVIGSSSYCKIVHGSPTILAERVFHEALIGERQMGASPGDGILATTDMSDANFEVE